MSAAEITPLSIERQPHLGGESTAVFSPDKAYRYLLTRAWGEEPPLVWVMLNPSTADAFTDDPTIRRCIRFARREGFGGISVVNLFGLRATDPKTLSGHPDPVGPANDQFIEMHARAAGRVVAAWGTGGVHDDRARIVGRALGAMDVQVSCLGITSAGHPRHPLYMRSDAALVPWEVPA